MAAALRNTPHPAAEGRAFDRENDAEALPELALARYYGNVDRILREVRCWPHHFDIGTVVDLKSTAEGCSIGLGLSPGDESYDQPYFYVNPYPNPDLSALPPLLAGDHWHTQGWMGVVATGGT